MIIQPLKGRRETDDLIPGGYFQKLVEKNGMQQDFFFLNLLIFFLIHILLEFFENHSHAQCLAEGLLC